MLRKGAPIGTEVYHGKWGLFGKIIEGEMKEYNQLTKKGYTMVHVEFPDFEAFCHRRSLIEIEKQEIDMRKEMMK